MNGGHFKSNFQQVEVHVNFERQKVKVKGVDYVCIFFFSIISFDENVIERAYVCFKSLTYCFCIVNGSFLIQK